MVLPLYSMDEENKGHRIYRMIDLFAGIGGMRIAFESSNQCYCVFTSEWDKQCQ